MTATVAGSVDCVLDWAGPVDLPLHNEIDVQAACGIMHVHGRKYGRPTALPIDYASIVARLLASQGVRAARLANARGMRIRRVSTSVAQAALLAVSQYLAAATAPDDWADPHLPGGPPFVSADGVRFEIETFDAERWQRFWTLLGAAELTLRRGWRPFQHRYATATCPLPVELYTVTRGLRLPALEAAAAEAGISIMPVRDTAPPAANQPWHVTPLSGPATAPALASPAPGAELPLAGLVVVEAGRRIQGPLAAHLLRLLGARVVRIEPPGGDPLRGMPPMAGDCSARFRALNRGKEVVEIDIKSAPGRRAVHELVAGADVFLHNWAPGKAAELRLDAEQLTRTHPGLVYAWASGWGDEFGPRPPMGTDFLVQAHSGLAALTGTDDGPAPSLMTLTDIAGALVSAEGVLAGLLTRANTGAGQRIDSSLRSGAMVCAHAGTAPRTEPRTAEVCTDLTALATDSRFAGALEHDGCTFVRTPWEFCS